MNTTVLITGESGVGKNVVARLVHHLSDRTNGPLVEINCAGIPAPLLESELFGYEAGAFTGASHKGKEGRIALADKGTLFLDEIGELPLRLQSKLLQVIQEKQIVKLGGVKPVSIDFRLVAATNQDLEALVEKKAFPPVTCFPAQCPAAMDSAPAGTARGDRAAVPEHSGGDERQIRDGKGFFR